MSRVLRETRRDEVGGEGPGRWGKRCGETGQAEPFPLGSTFPSSLCTGALHPNLSAAEVLNSNMELQRERETSPPASGVLVWKPGEHQELAFLVVFFFAGETGSGTPGPGSFSAGTPATLAVLGPGPAGLSLTKLRGASLKPLSPPLPRTEPQQGKRRATVCLLTGSCHVFADGPSAPPEPCTTPLKRSLAFVPCVTMKTV